MSMEDFRVDLSLPTEEQIKKLESNDIKLFAAVSGIQEDLKERYARIDESNKYLREQNTQILSAVLDGNKESRHRADERKKLQDENRAKFWIAAVGSGGIVVLLLQLVYQLLIQ